MNEVGGIKRKKTEFSTKMHLPWTNKSIIASGLWRSLTRQIYSAVSLANAGWNSRLKFSGDSVIYNEQVWEKKKRQTACLHKAW